MWNIGEKIARLVPRRPERGKTRTYRRFQGTTAIMARLRLVGQRFGLARCEVRVRFAQACRVGHQSVVGCTSHCCGRSAKWPQCDHASSFLPDGRVANPHLGGSGQPTQVLSIKRRSSPPIVAKNAASRSISHSLSKPKTPSSGNFLKGISDHLICVIARTWNPASCSSAFSPFDDQGTGFHSGNFSSRR